MNQKKRHKLTKKDIWLNKFKQQRAPQGDIKSSKSSALL